MPMELACIDKPCSGCPKKLSLRDIRQLVRYIRTNKYTHIVSLIQLKPLFHLDVHENTIKAALKEGGIHHRVTRRCPFLNNRDKKRRGEFAREHKNWTVKDWARVMFCDKMAIKLFMERYTKDYVWRSETEEFHPDCINYGRRLSGVGLMFWGAFRKGKMGPGGFFHLENRESIDSSIYRDQILLGPLKQFWEEAFKDIREPIVMEDNAPVHKKVCIAARADLGMISLEWPPNSTDLNPIENIWSYMKEIIARNYSLVSSAKEMKKIVRNIWDNFQDGEWDKLIESLPARMTAVIAVNSGSTISRAKSFRTKLHNFNLAFRHRVLKCHALPSAPHKPFHRHILTPHPYWAAEEGT